MGIVLVSRNPLVVPSPSPPPPPPPPPTGEPTMVSTGPRLSATTTITGDFTLNANVTISRYHITGSLYLNGANSDAVDCLVDGSIHVNQRPGGNYGVPSVGGQKISYCKANGIDSTGTGGIEIDHCQIGRLTGSPGTIAALGRDPTRNLAFGINMHDTILFGVPSVGAGSGFHLETLHLEGVTDSTFTNNSWQFTAPDAATAAEVTANMNLSVDLGPPARNVYDGNYIRGGGPFQFYPYMGTGVVWKNNRFYSYDIYPGGTHKTPSVYSKSRFAAGGTSMANWVDPTSATVFNNFADDVAWDLLAAMLA